MSTSTSMTTVFVLVTDFQYFPRAKVTIRDLRSIGQWTGNIVLISIDSEIQTNFTDFYQVQVKQFPQIQEKIELCKQLQHTPFADTIDGREITKLNQWEKLHAFDPFFKQWDRVVYVDAGLRILHNVHESLLHMDCTGSILAPDDGGNYVPRPNPDKLFITQVSNTSHKPLKDCVEVFGGPSILQESYFLNCIWIYDTKILDICSKQNMVDGMLQYPICKTNEMAIMNLFLHFKHRLWKPFPVHVDGCSKILFDWCELNNPQPSTWKNYCCLKYPCTISFEDT